REVIPRLKLWRWVGGNPPLSNLLMFLDELRYDIDLQHDLWDKHIAGVKIKVKRAKVTDRENYTQTTNLRFGSVSWSIASAFSSMPRRGIKNLAPETSTPVHWLRGMELELRDSLRATLSPHSPFPLEHAMAKALRLHPIFSKSKFHSVDYAKLWEKLVIEVYRRGSLSTRMTMTSESMLATKCR
ncbi:hypothetical protein HAX54_014121, partial [Datura stramonium]|nr:hypothetical protein [Datura stramonium]